MPAHIEKRYLPYTPEQIFALIADIEAYPLFLPWCAGARILRQEGNILIADLVINFKAFHEKYTSRVVLHPSESIVVDAINGPFHHFHNAWRLNPTDDGKGTLLEFEIDFSFRSALLNKLIGLLFEHALIKMIAAFETRAEKLYGVSQNS